MSSFLGGLQRVMGVVCGLDFEFGRAVAGKVVLAQLDLLRHLKEFFQVVIPLYEGVDFISLESGLLSHF